MSQVVVVEARNPSGLHMPHSQPIGFRLLDFARAQLSSAQEHLAAKGVQLHNGIHQARKSLRRVRAILALGDFAFDHHASVLDRDMQRLCHGLSPIRDAQALVTMLRRLRDEATEERMVLSDCVASAQSRRDELLVSFLERDPGLTSRRKRIAAFRERIARLDWQDVDEDIVNHGLERSERRAKKAESRADRHKLDDEAWHRFRRRLRRLHQQNTLLADVAPELHPERHPLEKRADALGEAQDDVLLLARCRNHSPFAAAHRPLLRKIASKRLEHARK